MAATPIHHTSTSTAAWDGGAAEKALETPLTMSTGNRVFAWRDPSANPGLKGSWKMPHHFVDGTGTPGAASTKACTAIVGILNGAHGGVHIPDADRRGVYDHVAAHLKDAAVTPPELHSHSLKGAAMRAAREGMRGERETRRVSIGEFQLRETTTAAGVKTLSFTGYASVTCSSESDHAHSYEMEDWIGPYREYVLQGSFQKTLAEGADVAFLVNHEGVTMARTKAGTLQLAEDTTGLHVGASLNPERSDVQILRAAIADGAIDEMSFAFRILRQDWSYEDDNGIVDRRFIREINLDKGDVSPVNYGANPHTGELVSIRRRGFGRGGRPSAPSPVLSDYSARAKLILADARGRRPGTPPATPWQSGTGAPAAHTNHGPAARAKLAALRRRHR